MREMCYPSIFLLFIFQIVFAKFVSKLCFIKITAGNRTIIDNITLNCQHTYWSYHNSTKSKLTSCENEIVLLLLDYNISIQYSAFYLNASVLSDYSTFLYINTISNCPSLSFLISAELEHICRYFPAHSV